MEKGENEEEMKRGKLRSGAAQFIRSNRTNYSRERLCLWAGVVDPRLGGSILYTPIHQGRGGVEGGSSREAVAMGRGEGLGQEHTASDVCFLNVQATK